MSTLSQAPFRSRLVAGRLLAKKLHRYVDSQTVVLALARGGVVVGFQVAKLLHLPLSVLIVRKISLPTDPELAIGALAENSVTILDKNLLLPDRSLLPAIIAREQSEILHRRQLYRAGRPLPDLVGRTALIIDDGLATGLTAVAAIKSVKKLHPAKIVYAAPVCAPSAAAKLQGLADLCLCLLTPPDLSAVGQYYVRFAQVTDRQVVQLLTRTVDFI